MNMKNLVLGMALLSSASLFAAPTKLIVKLKPGVSAKSVSFFSQKSVSQVKDLNVSFGSFYSVVADGMNQKSLDALSNDPNVEYAEYSQTYTVTPIMNKETIQDAQYSDQWGLKNTGRNSGGWFNRGKAGEDINAEGVWKLTRGAKEVKIAVIDTGVDYTHKDLAANMWVNEAEKNGQPGVDDDGNGYIDDVHGYDFANDDGDPQDGHGHGTHCAGNIGALHNRNGIRGVMNKVKMVGIKFLSDSGRGETEHAIKSIDYAVKVGVNLMSNSWGGGEFSQALMDSIKAADAAGIVFVAAAGNSRADNDARATYPANYEVDNVITVGSHDGSGKRSSFSNYGKKTVHVFAPGSNILSTVPGDRYRKMSGTSMACPLAAGAIGLLMAEFPNLTPLEIRERVVATGVKNGQIDNVTAGGRMDAKRLLEDTRN
jgi:subtilisin family serine protease